MDILNTIMGDVAEILRLLQGGPVSAEGLERSRVWNATMLRISIIFATAVMIWVWGGFFLRRRSRRRDG